MSHLNSTSQCVTGRIFIVDEVMEYVEERKMIRREAQWFEDVDPYSPEESEVREEKVSRFYR